MWLSNTQIGYRKFYKQQLSFKGIDPPINGRHRQQLAGLDPDPRLFAYNIWERIVEAYTACQLTKAEDKLIALSGIAKHMQPILGNDEYLRDFGGNFSQANYSGL